MNKTEVSNQNYLKCKEITDKIEDCIYAIKSDTKFDSHSNGILRHELFAELVSMGDKIIPYIFHMGIVDGWSSVHLCLLHKILGIIPFPNESAGKFSEMVYHWIGWYIQSPYSNHDVYYDLLNNKEQ